MRSSLNRSLRSDATEHAESHSELKSAATEHAEVHSEPESTATEHAIQHAMRVCAGRTLPGSCVTETSRQREKKVTCRRIVRYPTMSE